MLYVIVHFPAGDVAFSYNGMSQDAVSTLSQEYGHPFDFVTEAAYQAVLNAAPPMI